MGLAGVPLGAGVSDSVGSQLKGFWFLALPRTHDACIPSAAQSQPPNPPCPACHSPPPRRSVSVTAPFYSGTNAWGGRRLSSSDGGGANVGVNVNVPGGSSSGGNNNNNQQGQGQSQQGQQQQQQGQQGQTAVNVKAPFTDVGVDAGKSGRCV